MMKTSKSLFRRPSLRIAVSVVVAIVLSSTTSPALAFVIPVALTPVSSHVRRTISSTTTTTTTTHARAFIPPKMAADTSISTSDSQTSTSSSPRVFLVGVGFTQFLLAQQLSRASIPSVAMTDVARIEGMKQNWIKNTNMCTLVTNGETEWEHEAERCTALVICPEASNIPGKTVEALLSRMPLVRRVIILNHAGSTKKKEDEEKEKEEGSNGGGGNWFNQVLNAATGSTTGTTTLMPGDDTTCANSVEDTVQDAINRGTINDCVVIHRGKLNGGGGQYGLDNFYKVCGSEPEMVLQQSYDGGRLGTCIYPGDGMDISAKKKINGEGGMSEEEVELLELKEELKDKTHRLPLVNCIVSALLMEDPPERFSVGCDFGEVPLVGKDVERAIRSGCVLEKKEEASVVAVDS